MTNKEKKEIELEACAIFDLCNPNVVAPTGKELFMRRRYAYLLEKLARD